MGFLDEVSITAASGNGGKGCISFRRERFIPKGGPDGGDGGDGGNIILKATNRLHTLSDFSSRKHFKSQNGQPGRSKNRKGKDGDDVIIEVPLGTLVYDNNSGEILADLTRNRQEYIVLPGGKGGKGNSHFTTSTNRAPRYAQPGLPGQQKILRLNLKYLADIGLIGLPNVGKSTLLSRLTMARPRINGYPFTTIVPNLGVMEFEDQNSLTIADIPGLIEGASRGKGLGHRFLKHIERTRFLLHLLDISYAPENGILEDFQTLLDELEKYGGSLTSKDQMVVLNKIDLDSPGKRDLVSVRMALDHMGYHSIAISAMTGQGMENLKQALRRRFFG